MSYYISTKYGLPEQKSQPILTHPNQLWVCCHPRSLASIPQLLSTSSKDIQGTLAVLPNSGGPMRCFYSFPSLRSVFFLAKKLWRKVAGESHRTGTEDVALHGGLHIQQNLRSSVARRPQLDGTAFQLAQSHGEAKVREQRLHILWKSQGCTDATEHLRV